MSPLYKKLLVPVDGSDNALLACKHAAALASLGKMDVVLLHCYGDLPTTIGGTARDEIIAELKVEGEKFIAPCKKICDDAGVSSMAMIKSGNPGKVIINLAESEGCDMIVMGSRGLGDISSMIMGSVSHRVLAHATMPVLIVR